MHAIVQNPLVPDPVGSTPYSQAVSREAWVNHELVHNPAVPYPVSAQHTLNCMKGPLGQA